MLRFEERTDVSAADGLDPAARAQIAALLPNGDSDYARLKALVDGTAG